jgi:hypothetical protein
MVVQWVLNGLTHVGESRPGDCWAFGLAMRRRSGSLYRYERVFVDQWLFWRRGGKKACLDRIAWTKQDFSAGSGTTFTLILAPDHRPKEYILGTLERPVVDAWQ